MPTTRELADEYIRAYLDLAPGGTGISPVERFYAAQQEVQAQDQAVLAAMIQYISNALTRCLRDRERDTGRPAAQIWAEVEMTLRTDADVMPLVLRPDEDDDDTNGPDRG